MRGKLGKRIVIGGIILVLNAAIFIWGTIKITNAYRATSNQDIATTIGILLDRTNFEGNADVIVKVLQGELDVRGCLDDPATMDEQICLSYKHGQDFLQQYGYLDDDYIAVSTHKFIYSMAGLVGILLLADVTLVGVIYLLRMMRTRRNLVDLQKYLQKITEDDYDLALDSNSEDDFSLLRNELYKIAVTLREAAEQNRQSTKNLETALEDISHQLRTPLTALQITLDNLQNHDLPNVTRQEFLSSARRQVTSMTELVVTLLDLAKFDNKTIKLNPEPTKLIDIVDKAVDKISILAELLDVTIVVSGDTEAMISCDAAWQTEAIMNIVKNCVEFSPAGKKVEIILKDTPLFAKIIIQDYGPGMSRADQKRIFNRFYQAARTDNNHVGIGLNFAKTIIENEFGRIIVNSELGKGTKFTITYPKE